MQARKARRLSSQVRRLSSEARSLSSEARRLSSEARRLSSNERRPAPHGARESGAAPLPTPTGTISGLNTKRGAVRGRCPPSTAPRPAPAGSRPSGDHPRLRGCGQAGPGWPRRSGGRPAASPSAGAHPPPWPEHAPSSAAGCRQWGPQGSARQVAVRRPAGPLTRAGPGISANRRDPLGPCCPARDRDRRWPAAWRPANWRAGASMDRLRMPGAGRLRMLGAEGLHFRTAPGRLFRACSCQSHLACVRGDYDNSAPRP